MKDVEDVLQYLTRTKNITMRYSVSRKYKATLFPSSKWCHLQLANFQHAVCRTIRRYVQTTALLRLIFAALAQHLGQSDSLRCELDAVLVNLNFHFLSTVCTVAHADPSLAYWKLVKYVS